VTLFTFNQVKRAVSTAMHWPVPPPVAGSRRTAACLMPMKT